MNQKESIKAKCDNAKKQMGPAPGCAVVVLAN